MTSSPKKHDLPPWAEALRGLLAERVLTQVQLARLAGLDPGTVGHVLRGGHCTTETLAKLASALEIEMADLFTLPGERLDVAVRRDRLLVAVLRELSEDVAGAVADRVERRRREPDTLALPGERRLPFADE